MRQIHDYTVMQTFLENEFQCISMAVHATNSSEIALINEIKKDGLISVSAFNALTEKLTNLSFSKLDENYTLITTYNEGVPFPNFINNYQLTEEQRLQLMDRIFDKISAYDGLPKALMAVLIDENQITISDDDVLLNEIINLDKYDTTLSFQESLKVILEKLFNGIENESKSALDDYLNSRDYRRAESLTAAIATIKQIVDDSKNVVESESSASQEKTATTENEQFDLPVDPSVASILFRKSSEAQVSTEQTVDENIISTEREIVDEVALPEPDTSDDIVLDEQDTSDDAVLDEPDTSDDAVLTELNTSEDDVAAKTEASDDNSIIDDLPPLDFLMYNQSLDDSETATNTTEAMADIYDDQQVLSDDLPQLDFLSANRPPSYTEQINDEYVAPAADTTVKQRFTKPEAAPTQSDTPYSTTKRTPKTRIQRRRRLIWLVVVILIIILFKLMWPSEAVRTSEQSSILSSHVTYCQTSCITAEHFG